MADTTLELGEDLAHVLRNLNLPVQQTARELIVLELYRQRRISSGKAAELLGMEKADFIKHSSDPGIPFIDLTSEEFEQEVAEVEKIALEHGL